MHIHGDISLNVLQSIKSYQMGTTSHWPFWHSISVLMMQLIGLHTICRENANFNKHFTFKRSRGIVLHRMYHLCIFCNCLGAI